MNASWIPYWLAHFIQFLSIGVKNVNPFEGCVRKGSDHNGIELSEMDDQASNVN